MAFHPVTDDVTVSVILTTYNQEKWIARALNGVLSQNARTFTFEVLVGEDASSDSTGDICEEFARRFPNRIRLFRRPQNLGVQANYFDLIRHARGKFLADCAGDDEWTDPNKLAAQVELMEAHPDMALCHTAWVERNVISGQISASSHSYQGNPIEPKGALVAPLLQHRPDRFIHLCTAMWRRDLMLEALDRDPDLFLNPKWRLEDLQVEVAMAAKGSIGYLPQVTLVYSVGGPTISSGEDAGKAFNFLLSTVTLSRLLSQKYGVPEAQMRPFFSRRLSHLAKLAFVLNSRSKMLTVTELASATGATLSADARLRRFLLNAGLGAPLRAVLALRRSLNS